MVQCNGKDPSGSTSSVTSYEAVGKFLTAYINPTTTDGNATEMLKSTWITPSSDSNNQLRMDFDLPDTPIANARLYWAAPGYTKVWV